MAGLLRDTANFSIVRSRSEPLRQARYARRAGCPSWAQRQARAVGRDRVAQFGKIDERPNESERPFWSEPRMLIAQFLTPRIFGHIDDFFITLNETSGGSSDTL
jgi:hypothetical protein